MSYLVVMEVLLLLVICCSSQLYTQQTYAPPDTHPILEAIMDQQSSAVPLVTVLLQLVVSRPPLPPKVHLYKPQDTSGYTVMRLVRSAAGVCIAHRDPVAACLKWDTWHLVETRFLCHMQEYISTCNMWHWFRQIREVKVSYDLQHHWT